METLKCQYCGTETTKNGQPFKNGSALWTHENVHCEKRPGKAQPQQRHQQANKKCDCSDGGRWRLLNPRNPLENKAMQAGGTEVCTVCQEIA